MSALATLQAARELLAVPERWTQGCNARNASGAPAMGGDQPVSFCLDGALQEVARLADAESAGRLLNEVLETRHGYAFVDWNDRGERTHAEVLALLDKAIELARSREGQP